MKTLPIDRSRAFDPSDYPQEPEAYTPLQHFCNRFKEDERFLTPEVINKCISEGDLRNNHDGCACFRKRWGGVAYYLIAGFHEKGYRVLITGWPHLHSREIAMDSGRWSSEELDTIEELNDKKSESFGDKYPEYQKWLQQNL